MLEDVDIETKNIIIKRNRSLDLRQAISELNPLQENNNNYLNLLNPKKNLKSQILSLQYINLKKSKKKTKKTFMFYIIKKLKKNKIIINKLDSFGNIIPLGAFCFSITFILDGINRCKKNKIKNNYILNIIILIFGGIGQITTGILEYFKCRIFTCINYMFFGSFCLSNFFVYNNKFLFFYYIGWSFFSISIFIGSFKTNIFLFLQELCITFFFLLNSLDYFINDDDLNIFILEGIFEIISGFCSLYYFISQIINDVYINNILPTFPINYENNENDFFI